MAQSPPHNPNPDRLVNPALPTDLSKLRQGILPPLDPSSPILLPLTQNATSAGPEIDIPIPVPLRSSSSTTTTTTTAGPISPNRNIIIPPSANNVLLVIPTANQAKTALFLDHLAATKPPHVTLHPVAVPAESDVGEQPYDCAGPEGAVNRVRNAVARLVAVADDDGDGGGGRCCWRFVEERGIGSVMVGAVENFIVRPSSEQGHAGGSGGVDVPVDYGVVVLCMFCAVGFDGDAGAEMTGAGAGRRWEWRTAVSAGVTVPVEYWREAEKHGFADEDRGEGQGRRRRRYGKVTVGEVLAANVPELDKADWHRELAGRSRYELLREAIETMEVPWPEAGERS
ncbi:hypothetical protein VTK56DRAFT_6988 [Thermocarpiscus australiensis]